ncbi:MAG: Uma2 family endonuclease [Gammaproteobacteria bacterium]|nr:Uma2 family endonuclease [Gammaproteobacteria bacterium]
MVQSLRSEKMSSAAYLVWEAAQPLRHEYVDGEIFAMVGGTRQHETIALNLAAWLRNRLSGSPCRAYTAGMKVRVEAVNAYFYPDVFVTCSERDHQADDALSEPRLIIEVLSPSTEAYDRGDKFAKYRLLPSLEEYVLIDPESQRIESFRKDHTGHWVLYEFGQETMRVASLDLEIPLAEVFANL